MDLAIHDEILWCGCVKAARRLEAAGALTDPTRDPRLAFPWLVRGSWMNDVNQVSPLIDKLGNPDIGPQQATLFERLWRLSLEELMIERLPRFRSSEGLAQTTQSVLAEPQNVDGFGRYNPFDHLDVTGNQPALEYDKDWSTDARLGRAKTAHFTVTSHVPRRLISSSLGSERFAPHALTTLGRGLHTLADFFAHSNYVELLLWSLAWRGRLDQNIVDALNFDDGSQNLGAALFRCPLPAQGPRAGDLLRNAVLWYGDSPEETPIVSALFDTNDTVFSLLHIYAAHLVRTDGKDQTGPMLDMALAIFDIQGAPLIKGAWNVLNAFSTMLESIGQAARNLLASGVESAAGRASDPAVRDMMHTTAHLMRHYDSKEANEWAKAGKVTYLARELQLQMANELAGQSSAGMQLPHHSLLAKDHVGDEAGGQLRFKLACLLASEVTAKVIEWHFSPAEPKLDDYREVARRVLIHPWRLLDSVPNFDQVIGPLVRQADGTGRWQDQSIQGLDLLAGAL